MKPEETASHSDRIALGWQKQHVHSTYGIAALERAIQFVQDKSSALDIGCGSSGRFIEVFLKHGFTPAGLEEISGGFERERFDYSTRGG